jgi:hypothetical protein
MQECRNAKCGAGERAAGSGQHRVDEDSSKHRVRAMLGAERRPARFFADYSMSLLGLRDGRWKFIYELDRAGRSSSIWRRIRTNASILRIATPSRHARTPRICDSGAPCRSIFCKPRGDRSAEPAVHADADRTRGSRRSASSVASRAWRWLQVCAACCAKFFMNST